MMPTIQFLEPYACALGLPALIAWWYWARHGHGRWWRLTLLSLLVLAATRPELAWERGGSDVVLILDRSASMAEAKQAHEEMLRLVGDQRRTGDRLAVILSGDGVHLAQGPQKTGIPNLKEHAVQDTASDLTAALEQAATLITPGRTGRVIIHSDGEMTGPDARAATTRLALQKIAVDVLPQLRREAPDAAVIDITLPNNLRLGESFIAAARIISDANEQRLYKVYRGDKVISDGFVDLTPYKPVTITFADRPAHAGVVHYRVEIETDVVGAIAARFANLGQQALKIMPPGPAAEKFVADFEKFSKSPEGRLALEQLVKPGPLRETTLLAIENKLKTEMGPVLAAYGMKLIRSTIDEPVTDRDRQPGNNTAKAVLRVDGGERVLVMSGDGSDGNITLALRSAGMTVEQRPEGPITLDDLLASRVLVLDQVPASALTLPGMEAVARWVEHLGGGLVLTGGRRSFGAGGYHKSPIERVLPVTMELRDEHRKLAVAMAITLDRSGSMMAPVADGRTKMDLANEGAASVIELLGARDYVAVHAVDSGPHVILPLTPVTNSADMVNKVLGIRSQGGGIYVYQALLAAGNELLDAKTGTRHLVLFADAADAEEPGDYKKLLADYVSAGITVSVVAMGSANDVDAQFLEDVARRGNGRIAFAEAPEDIPRLFAQETMLVARSSWIGEPTKLKVNARLAIDLGNDEVFSKTWPTVAGYNLSYIRDRAQTWVTAPGDPSAPAIASWQIGSGRSVAVGIQIDDPNSPELMHWKGYAPLITSIVRWCSGGELGPGLLTAERHGRQISVQLELDPANRAKWPVIPPTVILARDKDIGEVQTVNMEAIDDGLYEAQFSLSDERTVVPAITIDSHAVLGPAVSLPYHPEVEPRFGKQAGHDILADIARAGNGIVRSDLVAVFDNPASPGQLVDISMFLLALVLFILILEILVRRLQLGWNQRRHIEPKAETTHSVSPTPVAQTVSDVPKTVDVPSAPNADVGLHEALRQLRKKK